MWAYSELCGCIGCKKKGGGLAKGMEGMDGMGGG